MKRTLHPKPTPTPRIVRTEGEWSEIISTFDTFTDADEKTAYLRRIGASRSSLFRWKRLIVERASPATTNLNNFDVERAIEVLCNCDPMREEMIDAVAIFGSWLRWPASAPQCRLGAAVLIARYFSAKKVGSTLSSLSPAEIGLLSRYISIDELASAIVSDPSHSVDFWDYSDFYTKYSENDLITDTVGVMLAFGNLSSKRKPSLERLFNLMQGGFYGEQYLRSKSGFNKLWKRTGAAAPFLFAERHDSYLKWRLAPFGIDYVDYFDEIMLDANSRQTYFAKSLWVVNMLHKCVGPYALAAVSFPAFPKWLEPMPIEGFSIDKTARELRDFIA